MAPTLQKQHRAASRRTLRPSLQKLHSENAVALLRQAMQNSRSDHAIDALALLVSHLRAGDRRLVRWCAYKRTAERQVTLANHGAIEAVTAALRHSDSTVRRLAAECVHLLSTDNNRHRIKFANTEAIPSLLKIISSGVTSKATHEDVHGAEEAAESLWILAYSEEAAETSHVLRARYAAKLLGSMVMHGRSARGRMWAAAALGNMTASYTAVPESVSIRVRKQAVKQRGLMRSLSSMTRRGPVTRRTKAAERPGTTKNTQRFSSKILAWGAVQALRNLALCAEGKAAILKANLVPMLRKLSKSPDWLEQVKGESALENLNYAK